MTNNNNVTGKQIISDCVTLVKHLSVYVVCVTARVAGKVKKMLADKKKEKNNKTEADKTTDVKATESKPVAKRKSVDNKTAA